MKDPKRVAAGRHSKTKGNSNERKLAKEFQAWWGWGEWARTPASGGWATAAHREAFRTCGDIITTATDFPFCLEAKKQENWRLEQILSTDSKCKIFEWWDQTTRESPKGMVPLLIIARNHVDPLVVFSELWFRKAFTDFHAASTPCFEWQLYPYISFYHGILRACDKPDSLAFMTLKNFFKIQPNIFGRKAENVQQRIDEPGTYEAKLVDGSGTSEVNGTSTRTGAGDPKL